MEFLAVDQERREEGVPFRALRPVLGGDRSNARRVVRSLIRRGAVELVKDPETGESRLKLTFMTAAAALWRQGGSYDDEAKQKEREWRRELDEAMAFVRAEHEERRRVHCEIEATWDEPGRSKQRRRSPGPNQLRVIAVLVRYAEDPQLGLPRGAVARIAQGSGEKANTLRAVRTLIRGGTLQQSKDGRRLRITYWRTTWLWGYVPDMVEPPLDDVKAEAVLESFGESGGVA